VLVLGPWTMRNHRLLEHWVPLTTNGGNTFWTANNPQTVYDPENRGLAVGWLMPGNITVVREGQTVLLGEVEGDRYLWKKGLQFVGSLMKEDPGLFGWILVRKFLAAFSLHAGKKGWELFGYAFLYSMAFVGLVLTLRKRPRPVLLYLVVSQYLISVLIFWGRGKYRVIIEPYLMLFVGVSCVWFLDMLKGKKS